MPTKTWIALTVLLVATLVGGALLLPNGRAESPSNNYFGTPEYQSVDPEKSITEQTSIFEIAGRTFEMPKVYIQTNLSGKRVLPDGINLLYVLPDFTSRADFASREEYQQVKRERRFAHMLIEPEAKRLSFDEMILNRRQFLEKEKYVGTINGLEYYKWYNSRPTGLVHLNDIYIEKDASGKVISFIECATLDSGARFPGCSHRFRDKSLLYDIYYNKENYFSAWNEQRQKAIAFIDSFERAADPQPTKEN